MWNMKKKLRKKSGYQSKKYYEMNRLNKNKLEKRLMQSGLNNSVLGMKFSRINPKMLMGFYTHIGTFRYYRNAMLDRYSLYFRNQHLIVNTKLTSINLRQAFWLIFKVYARTYFNYIKKVRKNKRECFFQSYFLRSKLKNVVKSKALSLMYKRRLKRKSKKRVNKEYLDGFRTVMKVGRFRDLRYENLQLREKQYKLTKIYVINAFEGISETLNLEFNKMEKKKFVDFRLNMHKLSNDKYTELLRGKLLRQIRIKKKLTKEQKDELKERELKELRRREQEPVAYKKLISWFKTYGQSYGLHYKTTWMKGFMTNRPKNLWRREPVKYYPLPSLVIVIYSEKYLDIANEAIRRGIPSIGLVTTEMEPVFMYNIVIGQLNVEFIRFFLHLLKETVLMAKFYNKYIVRFLRYQHKKLMYKRYFNKYYYRKKVKKFMRIWIRFRQKREFDFKQRRFVIKKYGERQFWLPKGNKFLNKKANKN